MKKLLRLLVLCAVACVVAAPVRATEEDDESFSKKLRDFFVRTPTPTPAKRRRVLIPRKTTPTPAPKTTATPKASAAPQAEASATPESTPPPTTPQPEERPTPGEVPSETPIPSETPSPTGPPKPSETPTPSETPKPSRTPKPTARPIPTASVGERKRAPIATITTDEIVGYENYPADVRKIIEAGLALTTQNLGYKYGSADPAGGGMDCSGFIYYVLSKNGISDAPRDAREQYVWVRKAGNFQAVLGHSDDTFELDGLEPGDLLFWASTLSINRDPDITQTMIYLGREKATNQRLMLGASEGRTYKGQTRVGVGVFDFKVGRLAPKADDKPGPVFVGYGHVPGLPKE